MKLTVGNAQVNWLTTRWIHLSRSDRVALLLAEAGVVAACLWVLPVSEFTRAGWQTDLVVWGLVFVFLQSLVIFVVAVIVSRRRKAMGLPTRVKTNFGRGALVWVTLGLMYWGGGYVADWVFPESEWATKWRYGLENDLRDAVYVMDKRPHGCEFWSAPLGDKHCHYDKVVTTIRVRNGLMSYDDGKSWSQAAPDVRASVFVSWSKVEE